jgi:RNA polymerase sigma-70 factor (ECF subfamily)
MTTPKPPASVEDLLAHATWLRRLARQLVRGGDGAEDLVQETMGAALRSPPAAGRPARPWLAEVLRNFGRQALRSDHNRRRREAEAAARREHVSGTEESLERLEAQRLLVELVGALDEPFRATVLLRYYDGLSAAQIARATGVPAGTVRWRLSEAVNRLRAGLDARHRGGRRAWSALLLPFAPGRAVTVGKGAFVMAVKTKTVVGVLVLGLVAAGAGWRLLRRSVGAPAPAPASAPGRARLDRATMVAWQRAQAGPPGTIEGSVLDADGRAVPGAFVALTAEAAEERLHDPEAARPAATAVASVAGSYRTGPLPPGLYVVTATAPGWAPGERLGLALLPGESLTGIDLVLGRGGARLFGRVLDAGGGAIGGAVVRARALGAAGRPSGVRTFAAASAGDGRYELTLARGSYVLVAEADGYAPLGQTLALDQDKAHDLRLAPASRIAGRVVVRGGAPVPGALVRLEEERVLAPRAREVVADAAGRFVFASVAAGAYQVRARKGALVGRHPAEVALAPAAGSTDVVVEVAAGLLAAGLVSAHDGPPIAGARVRAGENAGEATTGADGRFRIEGLLPGPLRLEAGARGYAAAELALTLAADRVDLALVLPAAGRVVGRVLSRAGRPLGGAQVAGLVARPGRVEVITSTAVARSEEDGRFTLEGLGAGELRIEAEHPAEGRGLAGPFALGAGEQREVDVRIGAGSFVRGTVRWEDRRPAAGVEVMGNVRGKAALQAFTDDLGRYEVGPLCAGEAELRAVPDPDPLSTDGKGANAATVSLGSEERKEGVDLVLPKHEAAIDGLVLDPDGQPLAGATVGVAADYKGVSYRPYNRYAIDLGEIGTFTVLSAEDGSFSIGGLPRTTLNLWAAHPSFPEAVSYGVSTGSAGVRVRFVAGATLAGQVVAGGKPVVDYELALALSSENDASKELRAARGYVQRTLAVHDFTGAFAAARLHPAIYDLVVTAADGRGGRLAGVNVTAGQRREDLLVELGETAVVRGRVLDAAGAPVAGARVSTWVTLMLKELVTTTGDDGAFTLAGVLPGAPATLMVRADPQRFPPRTQVVQVAAGAREVDAGVLMLARDNLTGSRK